jgi:hypothetical protein
MLVNSTIDLTCVGAGNKILLESNIFTVLWPEKEHKFFMA